MGKFRYRIETPNLENRDVDAPGGWKDSESVFPRSDTYKGIFRKFAANNLTFKGTGAQLLRDIKTQTGFESSATFKQYEEDFDNGNEEFLRFQGSFDFVKAKYINGNDGKSVDINIVDSSFWNTIKNRESDKPQLSKLESLDGLQISGFTNEEVFITLPAKPINLFGALTSANAPIQNNKHAAPLTITSSEDDNVVSVIDSTVTDSIDGAFYIVSSVNSLLITINFDTDFEIQSFDPTINLRLKHYNSSDIQQNPGTDILASITGTSPFPSTKNLSYNNPDGELFDTVSDGDYFILSVEGGLVTVFESLPPYLARVDTAANVDALPEIEVSGMLLHELVSRLLQIISNTDIPLYSELLGGTNSEPRSYASDGALRNILITNGERIRQFTRDESPITLGFKDIFTTIFGIRPIGVGIEKIGGIDNIRLEEKRYFFDDRIVLTIDNAANVTESTLKTNIVSRISIGYSKAEYEQKDGLFEYNQKSSFSTPISVVSNEYNAVSIARADQQAINNARAKSKSEFPTDDTRYDTSNFLITLIKNTTFVINGDFESWTDDNTPDDWDLLGTTVVLRKLILNSNRCYFVSGFAGFAQIKQDIAMVAQSESLNISFSYENIGDAVINPFFSIKLNAGANVYYLQSDGTWLITTETFIYYDANIPPTEETELQSFRTFSLIADDIPEDGTISFKMVSTEGLVLDDVYFGKAQYKAKTNEGYTSIENSIDGDNSMNLDITPARNLRNHGSEIRAALENNLSKFIRFNTSDKNSTLSTQKDTETVPVVENADVQINDLDEPYLTAIQWEFDLPINKDVIDVLNDTFAGETKQKYLGLVKWRMNTNDDYKYIWIQDVQTGGQSGKGRLTGVEISEYVTPIEI
jgi:hypothetical protein